MKKIAFSALFTFMCLVSLAQWSKGTLGVVVKDDTVILKNDSCWRNCGSRYEMEVTISGNNLVWTQHDMAGGAFCDCPFNLSVTVANLQPGLYNADVYCTVPSTVYVGSISFEILALTPPEMLSVFNPYQSICLLENTEQHTDVPGVLSLVYPNPFRDQCFIRYDNRGQEQDHILICNMLGAVVRKFSIPPGEQGTVVWDGRNSAGLRLAAGTYFYHVQSGNTISRYKLILLE